MAHYERLSLDAQQRQIKAVWQSRRLALGEKRRAMLVEDGVGGLIEEGDWRGGGDLMESLILCLVLFIDISHTCGSCLP